MPTRVLIAYLIIAAAVLIVGGLILRARARAKREGRSSSRIELKLKTSKSPDRGPNR
jgi:hypothetical protein